MKDFKKIIRLAFYISSCFLFFSKTESNAQVNEMSAQDLTSASTAVFYGKCSKKSCDWDGNHRIIYTYVTIVPDEYLKGNLGSSAVIAVPGGQVGNIVYEVSDMPVFTEGEEVMAFVRPNTAGKNLVTGGFQGKMKMEKDKNTGKWMVFETAPGKLISEPNQGIGQDLKFRREKLEDFIAKVKAYLKN
ncbi:MAG: hypothetical protein WA816_09345 [Bacteroidales bacterium]